MPGFYIPDWVVYNRNIIISRESCIDRKCSRYVKEGIDEFTSKIGLVGFSLEESTDDKIRSQIKNSTREERDKLYLDFEKLGENLQNLDPSNAYVILTKLLEHRDDQGWVRADYNGYLVIKLAEGREEKEDHIRKVAKKGAVRLFGYKIFKDIEISDLYKHNSSECLTDVTDKGLCKACENRLKILWKENEKELGQEFLEKEPPSGL